MLECLLTESLTTGQRNPTLTRSKESFFSRSGKAAIATRTSSQFKGASAITLFLLSPGLTRKNITVVKVMLMLELLLTIKFGSEKWRHKCRQTGYTTNRLKKLAQNCLVWERDRRHVKPCKPFQARSRHHKVVKMSQWRWMYISMNICGRACWRRSEGAYKRKKRKRRESPLSTDMLKTP